MDPVIGRAIVALGVSALTLFVPLEFAAYNARNDGVSRFIRSAPTWPELSLSQWKVRRYAARGITRAGPIDSVSAPLPNKFLP